MKKFIVKDTQVMSELAAAILKGTMVNDKRVNLALTTGSSPKGTYELVTKWYKENKENLSNVFFYNFDEIEPKDGQTSITITGLRDQFFAPAEVPESQIQPLTYANYARYDQMIAEAGGLDAMLIGLGEDGHFCGNMPYATDFSKDTYQLMIKEEYPWYEMITGMFGEQTPDYIVTMGLQSLLRVKHLILIINGAGKAKAVKQMFDSEITTAFPASALRLHPNLTVIMDEDAASLLC